MFRDDLRRELEELERLEAIANQALEAWENAPDDDEELEETEDKAYRAQFNQFEKGCYMIADHVNEIDIRTARTMVMNPKTREKLKLITGITA